jgi:hypothetical protein
VKLVRLAFDIAAFALGPFLVVGFRPRQDGSDFPLISPYQIGDYWLLGPADRCLFAAGVALVVMGVLAHLRSDAPLRPRGFVDTTLVALGVFCLTAGLAAKGGKSAFLEAVRGEAYGYVYAFPGPRLLLAAGASSLCLGVVRTLRSNKSISQT